MLKFILLFLSILIINNCFSETNTKKNKYGYAPGDTNSKYRKKIDEMRTAMDKARAKVKDDYLKKPKMKEVLECCGKISYDLCKTKKPFCFEFDYKEDKKTTEKNKKDLEKKECMKEFITQCGIKNINKNSEKIDMKDVKDLTNKTQMAPVLKQLRDNMVLNMELCLPKYESTISEKCKQHVIDHINTMKTMAQF